MGNSSVPEGVQPDITNCLDRGFVASGRNHVLVASGTRLMVVVAQSKTQTGADVASVCVLDLLSTYRRGDVRDAARKPSTFDLRLNTSSRLWEVFDPADPDASAAEGVYYKTDRRPAVINDWTHTVQCEGPGWRGRLQTAVGRNLIRAQHRPRCPACRDGAPLVTRNRADGSAQFFGCRNFHQHGCPYTLDVERAFDPAAPYAERTQAAA